MPAMGTAFVPAHCFRPQTNPLPRQLNGFCDKLHLLPPYKQLFKISWDWDVMRDT